MSTGKRLAKRSILGTRVCAPTPDGLHTPGVIQATKTDADEENIYTVTFADKTTGEYRGEELIGPGFQTIAGLTLKSGQRVYVTFNGREVSGVVQEHDEARDDVLISVQPSQHNHHITQTVQLHKRLEEVRLLESRKSARLQDLDTDYSRLAEGQGELRRRAASLSIDVPPSINGRKRRPSASEDADTMDDCMAAMVLMRLSCSPKSPRVPSDAPDRLEAFEKTPSQTVAGGELKQPGLLTPLRGRRFICGECESRLCVVARAAIINIAGSDRVCSGKLQEENVCPVKHTFCFVVIVVTESVGRSCRDGHLGGLARSLQGQCTAASPRTMRELNGRNENARTGGSRPTEIKDCTVQSAVYSRAPLIRTPLMWTTRIIGTVFLGSLYNYGPLIWKLAVRTMDRVKMHGAHWDPCIFVSLIWTAMRAEIPSVSTRCSAPYTV
ncbi:glucose transporter 4 enhancer factor isoform X2 [Amblyomma americanum]